MAQASFDDIVHTGGAKFAVIESLKMTGTLSEASQPSCLYSMEAEDYCRSSYVMKPAHDREYPGIHSGFLLLIWRTEPAAGE